MLPGRGVKAQVQGVKVIAGNRELLEEEGVSLTQRGEQAAQAALAQGCTLVYLAVEGRLAGLLALADTLRPDAAQTIAQVKAAGVQPVLLTGDRQEAAQSIAKQLSLTEVKWGCLPQDKLDYIGGCQEQGQPVCMLGDGINDAPRPEKKPRWALRWAALEATSPWTPRTSPWSATTSRSSPTCCVWQSG